MKRKSLYAKALMLFSAMACTVAWTSCSNSDWVVDADPTPDAEAGMVKLSINAYMSDPTGTRAGLDDNTFVAGDTIGLYITKEWGQSPYSDEATSYNVPAVFDGTNWTILKDVYLTEEDASIWLITPTTRISETNIPRGRRASSSYSTCSKWKTEVPIC